jgi:MtN3 and saliva related transmembrane protein
MQHDVIGYIAAALTTVSFVPQVLKTWKSKQAADVSLWMYCIFTAGIIMWLIYGVLSEAWPVAVANAVTLVLAGLILAMKLKWK